MPTYIRPRVAGATVFFTVALADRRSDLLVRQVNRLRDAVRRVRADRPFGIDAWVVLPDHLHAVWTLPAGDKDFSTRWGAIKAQFSMSVRRAGFTPPSPVGRANGGVNPALRRKGEVGVWQPRFWGEARPENGPKDRFQRRTGEAPAAKPTISGIRQISTPISGIAGAIR
jgi:putative transposase